MKKFSIIGLILGALFGVTLAYFMRRAQIENGIMTTCKNGGCYLD